jgi:hypothetical protein
LGATFNKRKKYVTHYINLILYLKLGMQLTKVWRVLAFTQSNFLKTYIDHCTRLRQQSKTEFGKRLWKLFANAVFGKFIEQTRNYVDCQICVAEAPCKKWINSPRFTNMKIISKDLVIVFSKRTAVLLNKPYAIGFTILEKSKHFMYEQYYQMIRPALGNCKVIMSDTDSLVLAVETEKKENNLKKLRKIMDFSNYPTNNIFYHAGNKNKLGFWKDELQGGVMTEFCGLRSKTYAFLIKENKNNEKNQELHSKCKGITKGYRKKIPFSDYKKCVQTLSKVNITQFQIRAKNHKVFMARVHKLCFSSFDDKRYLMKCGVHSLAYGSSLIRNTDEECPLCEIYNPLT